VAVLVLEVNLDGLGLVRRLEGRPAEVDNTAELP
jgi:hypothetical protein